MTTPTGDPAALAKAWVQHRVDASHSMWKHGDDEKTVQMYATATAAEAACLASIAAQQAHIDDLNRLVNKWRPRALKAEDRVDALTADNARLMAALDECARPIPGFVGKTISDCYEAMMIEFRRRVEAARRAQAAHPKEKS